MDPTQQEQQQDEVAQLVKDVPVDLSVDLAIQEVSEEGAKAFALKDYEAAVEKYSLATQMLSEAYGEMHPNCADTWVKYGKALFEAAVQKSSVLGGIQDKKSKDELEAVVAAASGSSAPAVPAAGSNPRFVFEGDDDDDEDDEDEDGEGGAQDGEEDGDDFTIAWEVLDLARVIYHRIGTEEALLKLGDVHIALGDVSLESENFEQAVNDFREALLVKEARLESDDRELAEAHYKLALALEYSSTESAIAPQHIEKATTVLKKRIERLNGQVGSGKGKSKATDATESETSIGKELVELHELVGEMEQKLQDMLLNQEKKPVETSSQSHIELLTQMLDQQRSQAANDISGLIKSKKAPSAATASASGTSTTVSSSSGSGTKRPADEEANKEDEKKAKTDETA